MYSTCIHCHAALGANERIDRFPVGKRLAFDPAQGRLWVVCPRCRRWNLSPLEERWEAIESCERLFRATPLRASTDNIGLAYVPEGPELVRIGKPTGREFAAWRYVRELKRRWRMRGLPLEMIGVGGTGAIVTASPMADGPRQFAINLGLQLGFVGITMLLVRPFASVRILDNDGRVRRFRDRRGSHAVLMPEGEGWGIRLQQRRWNAMLLHGDAARALRGILALRNLRGARQDDIDVALARIARARDPERFVRQLALATERTGVDRYPTVLSIALEIAVHDALERRAIEGELAALLREWEIAQEVARVADDLLVSAPVLTRLDALRGGARA
jgi:hypothetical protein